MTTVVAIPLGPELSLELDSVYPMVLPSPEGCIESAQELGFAVPLVFEKQFDAPPYRLSPGNVFAFAEQSQPRKLLIRQFDNRPHGVIIP